MKITSLIPSESIAKHLESQGYEFNPLQCAYIIAISNKLAVREKQEKWKRLSESMSDCEIFNGLTQEHHESLFSILQKLAELQNGYIEQFMQEDEGIYRLESAKRGNEDLAVFGKPAHTLFESMHPEEIENRKDVIFTVSKQKFGSELSITATLNELGEVFDLQVIGAPFNDEKDLEFFSSIELAFPLPFAVGDVVYEIGQEDIPLVIKGFSNCGRQQICCAKSYFEDTVTDDWTNNAFFIEYYKKPFRESEAKLKELSEKLKAL